ncbi:MAG: hypothetical protein LQ351_001545 [Letrouitia transgressa]|nr:MAG: hypothetical protein LQ351_001545 [Letrouitia transgressa]
MSGAAYWLQRQRKADLHSLAQHTGMKDYADLLKPDLEVRLDNHLRANQTTFGKDPQLSGFYKRMVASPVKRDAGLTTALALTSGDEGVKKPKQRRQTLKAREELEHPSETDTPPLSRALQPITPQQTNTSPSSSSLAFARALPLPASPAVLADRIEAQTTSFTTSLSSSLAQSRFTSTLYSLRTALSSPTSIHLLALFLELFFLLYTTIPFSYLTTLPAFPSIGLNSSLSIKIPDLFALLSSHFWAPVGLWAATSVFLPLMAGWVVNFPHATAAAGGGGGGIDGVSFGVVRGLLAWIVYIKGATMGGVDKWESRGVVEGAVPGGSVGMVVGAGLGVLAGIWEAVLKK